MSKLVKTESSLTQIAKTCSWWQSEEVRMWERVRTCHCQIAEGGPRAPEFQTRKQPPEINRSVNTSNHSSNWEIADVFIMPIQSSFSLCFFWSVWVFGRWCDLHWRKMTLHSPGSWGLNLDCLLHKQHGKEHSKKLPRYPRESADQRTSSKSSKNKEQCGCPHAHPATIVILIKPHQIPKEQKKAHSAWIQCKWAIQIICIL